MPEPREAETTETTAETPTAVRVPEPKIRAPRQRNAESKPKQPIAGKAARLASKSTEAKPALVRGKRRVYSQKERAGILAKIAKSISPNVSIKKAVGQAGISEPTYYQWKKLAKTPVPADELRDLLALEEENKQLKKQLAERLRQENAELRKKLGLI